MAEPNNKEQNTSYIALVYGIPTCEIELAIT